MSLETEFLSDLTVSDISLTYLEYSNIQNILAFSTSYGKAFVNNDIFIYDDFVNFVKSLDGKIEIIYDQGILKNRINNKDKLICQGLFKITFKDWHFYHASLFLKSDSSQNEIFIVSFCNEMKKFTDFKNEFIKHSSRGSVLMNSNIISIGKQFDKKNLISSKTDEISSDIDEFFSKKDFYRSNNIPFIKILLVTGEYGSGKSTFVKSLVLDRSEKFYICSRNSNNESMVSTFTDAENEQSILYFEYVDDWLNQTADANLLKELLDSSNPENGLFVIISSKEKKSIPLFLSSRQKTYKELKFGLPKDNNVKEYLKDLNLNEKMYKFLSKEILKNKFTWSSLNLLKQDLIMIGERIGDDSEVKQILNTIKKELVEVSGKIDINKYFEESENK